VYARYFDKRIKFFPTQQSDVFGKKSKFNKLFQLENNVTLSLKVYVRYKGKKLSVMASSDTSISPTTIYTVPSASTRETTSTCRTST